jgi:LysM repeat protein
MKNPSKIISFIPFNVLMQLFFVATIFAQAPVKISAQIETYGQKSYYMHTVEPQQTLFGIAQAYKVAIETIVSANPDALPGLRVNQILRIPVAQQSHAADLQQATANELNPAKTDSPNSIYHVTGKRETFSYIASIYSIPVNDIRKSNPDLNEPIPEGEYVVVPIAIKEGSNGSIIRQLTGHIDPLSGSPRKKPENQAHATQGNQATYQQPTEPLQRANEIAAKGISDTTSPMPAQTMAKEPETALVGQAGEADTKHLSSSLAGSYNLDGIAQHAVKPQETLFSIARHYGLTVSQLMDLNPGLSKILNVGQELKVPQKEINPKSNQPKEEVEMITHTVAKGETLYQISRDYAVSIRELKEINPGLTDRLTVGQELTIPKKKISSPYIDHEIENSATVRRLSRNFNISRDRFYAFNPAVGRRVYPGQNVRIPIADHLTISSPAPIQADTVHPEEPPLIGQIPEKVISCPDYLAHAKRIFRVALMVPFYLDEAEDLQFDNLLQADQLLNKRPFSFLQFYEGFLFSADSLITTKGLQLNLYVYDVGQDMDQVVKALSDPKLRSTDLIIGPFFNKPFELVALFAREHNIPVVNPLSQRPEIIEGFPNVVKVKPTYESQYEQVARLISENYPEAKVFIYRSHSWTHQRQSQLMRQAVEKYHTPAVEIANQKIYNLAETYSKGFEELDGIVPFVLFENKEFSTAQLQASLHEVTVFENPIIEFVYTDDSLHEFNRHASAVRENVVIALSDDNVFAMELVNKLNQVADTFSIKMIGLPNWKSFDNLFTENLLKMQMHHLVPGHINYNTLQTEQFIYNYRMRYNAEPGTYAYEGFDIGWYFLQALMRYGDGMLECLPNFYPQLSQSQFHFERNNETSGLENTFWNIYRYQNHKLVPLINPIFDKNSGDEQIKIW